ncbi:MAG TPA: CPBP family intramembrane glutamic endopeptidase [Candidatus Eremiobacteraceae bacterium]|nr:CPBP family intramembrane glutamic endopeptidase [Candidatus Eremiobacteraceae bacterium]
MPWDFWLIFFILAVLIPWRGRVRLQHLLTLPAVGPKEKLVLYGSTIAFQWLLAGIVAWRSIARGLTLAQLGLARPISSDLLLLSFVGAIPFGAFQWFNLRRVGRMTGAIPEFMRKLAERVLPQSPLEFAPYCALALTAGICEEFLYRGFAMAALTRLGLSAWLVVVISSALFGLAHTYQGKTGVVGTTLMGLVLGGVRAAVRTLVPVVLWHAVVDIVAGVAGPKYLRETSVRTNSIEII